ncbi:MAG: amino acid ABC transporter ATP-binding/permease protein [Phenylobacterium sp.]|uniref:amino acid ABC transporter ATP-binding/permease protein n=1 Tax=Phenylobacterium sp. TaxID=1871053 RepID=UPI003918E4DB
MRPAAPLARFLAGQVRRRRTELLAAGLCAALTAAASTALLGVSGWFLAGAALAGAAGPIAAQAFNYLLPSAGIRLFAIVRTAGRYGERLLSHQAALRALAELRPALFAALAAASPQRALALSSGEAAARLVQDVEAVETRFVRRSAPWAAAAGAGAAATLIALASPWASAAFLAGFALLATGGGALARRLGADPGREGQRAAGALKDSLAGYAAAAPELHCFGLVDRAVDAVMAHEAALSDARLRRADAEALLGAVQAGLSAATLAAVIALSAGAPLPMAALAALAALAGLEGAAGLLRAAEQSGPLAEAEQRLSELMDQPPAPRPESTPRSALRLDGHELAPGARIALVGPSGAGKTRTLEALVGLRPAPDGRIVVDAEPLESLPIGAARRLFAFAPQDARLVTGTVRENLAMAAPKASEAELWTALADAVLDARVRDLPGGLDAWLGDGGQRLSGGERRRLSLARAYLRQAPFLLLDEPTEGLDAATEARVTEALDRRLGRTGQGLVLVSHRPAPLALCETQIAVTRD